MWSIEVLSDASEEEINEALQEELDFDYIRECIAELKKVVEKYGPFKEVQEGSESTSTNDFTRTYDDKRGWICDELESIDTRRVWTLVMDQWNARSWISSGYSQESSPPKFVTSWFIADKPIEQGETILYPNTEFVIGIKYTDDEDDEGYFALDLWSLVDSDEVSDQAIMGALAN
jgi:hypothetical protein